MNANEQEYGSQTSSLNVLLVLIRVY